MCIRKDFSKIICFVCEGKIVIIKSKKIKLSSINFIMSNRLFLKNHSIFNTKIINFFVKG
jgi:hypothetical protein